MTDIMTLASPPDWQLYRLGQLFRERKQKGSDKDFPPLSVTMGGIVPQLETAAKSDDGDNRKIVHVGDYVLNSRSDRKGSGGISAHDGSVSLISIVLEPRNINPRFAHHLLRSPAFQEEFYRWGHGIVADLWTTRYSDMKNIRLRVPDLATQRQIADFLDRETARIELLIEKKQRLVALLGEKLQSTLEKAIFVEGTKKVPLRRAMIAIEQGWSPDCETRPKEQDEWGVLKVGCVNGWSFSAAEHKALPQNLVPRPKLEIREGDLLMSRANSPELVGSAAIVSNASSRLMLCDKLYRLRLDTRLLSPSFALLGLRSKAARLHYSSRANGASSSMQNISQETVRTLPVPLPPLKRQAEAVEELERQKKHVSQTTSAVNSSIDRLKEYRSALITAAVTGQIDVETYAKSGTPDRRLNAIQEEMGANEIVVPFEDESVSSLLSDMNHADMLEPKPGKPKSKYIEFLVERFNGIKIEIFANEHPPPHFRVKTNAGTGNFSIDSCEPLHGAQTVLRRHREIKKWHTQNRQALIQKWNETRPSDCTVGKFRDGSST